MRSDSKATLFYGLLLGLSSTLPASTNNYVPSAVKPPPPAREFRGAWVATVGNLDWPSRAGLTTEQQQAELLTILDRAVQLRLNAIILQVRPNCDALYSSAFEPWSEYLTGQMGRAPAPYYDPLTFAIEGAHQRGLELHAWFNPFRARHTRSLSPASAHHVSKLRPELVKPYGAQLWLDPGEPAVHDYSREVILEVVKRYDIDGVHLDDYFYPYPEKDARGQALPFPDGASWQRYVTGGGKLSREQWRRDNVDRFIHTLYEAIKSEKPFVKFGVSPFGIWRPGFPEQIKGFDAYNQLFADSRKWLAQGWLDYLAPQLYWSIEPREQSYPALLKWWSEENPKQRHIWPGDAPGRIGPNRSSAEIVNQVRLTRQQAGASGNIHWSMKSLMQNRGGIADALRKEVYAQPALIPASPWLEHVSLAAPNLQIQTSSAEIKLRWEEPNHHATRFWVLQTRSGSEWTMEVLPQQQTSRVLRSGPPPEVVALTALDRCGNAGPPAVLELRAQSNSTSY